MLCGSSAVISCVISTWSRLSPNPNMTLFAVLTVEGHSRALVSQALRTGSPELPAFVSTPAGHARMLAFVCSDVQTSSPVTLSLTSNFPYLCFWSV